MRRGEKEYYESSIAKVLCLIDKWKEEQEDIARAAGGKQNEPRQVERFSDLLRGVV